MRNEDMSFIYYLLYVDPIFVEKSIWGSKCIFVVCNTRNTKMNVVYKEKSLHMAVRGKENKALKCPDCNSSLSAGIYKKTQVCDTA